MAHWPWWIGGPALAAVVLAHVLFTRRALGVSGVYRRLAFWRTEREAERARAELAADADALERALLEATAEEAGLTPDDVLAGAADGAADAPAAVVPEAVGPPPLWAHALFLAAIAGGAWLALQVGHAHGHAEPATSPAVSRAAGGWLWLLMTGGGLLVGLGTSLAGGCASGHGLSGCSRLRPASMVATATFLAAAVAVTQLGARLGW